jgi:hypothetical protein
MTVKEFKELFKGDIKFFDCATGEAIGEEFKTDENERLQELEITGMELGIKTNSIKLDELYENSTPFVKVFVDINTKTLKMREAIRTVAMSLYNTWYVRDTEDNLLYSNDEYVKDNGGSAYRANIKDLPIKILNSLVTKIRTAFDRDTSEWSITFNIITEEEE